MDAVMSLFIPFVMLCAICILVDKLTIALEALLAAIPGLPDHFEPYIAYIFVFSGGFVVCWRMDWSFFNYLDAHFQNQWEAWLFSALLVSGGSALVRKLFDLVSLIPSGASAVTTTVKRAAKKKTEQPELNFDGDRYSENI